jgi:hypothetical protein
MKAILVATIGTRDLMFQVSSGFWCNLGDDRMKDGDEFGEQFEVLSDLGLGSTTYRDLTQYLLEGIEIYRQRIKPVIIGKILSDKAAEIDKIYLIGTNQNLAVREREKDTLYTCELIKNWVEHYYRVSVEIIHLGTDSTNPANFEQMFCWWRYIWQNNIKVQPRQLVWVCLKGGVGQTSEASRISGLSLYGDRIQFFEFKQNYKANRSGVPSDYYGPFLGTNYLWDRTQQQALKLLERYDYAGFDSLSLLQTYFQQDLSKLGSIAKLVEAALSWNQGNFETFFNLSQKSLTLQQKQQTQSFWWQAYEEAYLAVIRLRQNNTTEAMFHSFRAVEGIMYKWAITTFSEDVVLETDEFASLACSVIYKYSALRDLFEQNNRQDQVKLDLRVMRKLLEVYIPEASTSFDLKMFYKKAREQRNKLFHCIGGLSQQQVLQAWGSDINNQNKWENRILSCLNTITGNQFQSLAQASLFASVHQRVEQAIKNYQP